MFGASLKSVPGCLVSIVPMLIGVPVAFTPGFGPHDDVLSDAPLEPLLAGIALEFATGEPPALLLLLLLPQAAITAAPTSSASAVIARARSAWWNILTFLLRW